MTKQCHHHFLVNQEKAEKHVFRKSKKYRTLCSVAIGTMVTAIVAWGGAVAQADEVTAPQDSQKLPYRRPTVANIQQKISEINLLIELNTSDKSYHEIKEEFVTEIAKLDIRLHETQEKIAALDKMAEVFINLKSDNQESRKLAKYDFVKLNLSETLSLEKVNQDIFKLQKQLDKYLENYEDVARRLENFVEILNKEYTEASKFKYQESLDQPEI